MNRCSLPLTLAFEYPNIEALSRYLAREVLDLDAAALKKAAPPDPEKEVKVHDDCERLSEDELVELLEKKLEQLR